MAAVSGRIVSAPRLTEEQRRAIATRGVSVGLSAGAGCGKTCVLTERFISHLVGGPDASPAELSRLVAITFTERAAREMRDRIRGAALRRLFKAPEAEVAYWSRLLRELDTARISTIHSYCTSLLRRHAVEAGLDPRFQVLDEAVAGMLRYELVAEGINRRLAERSELLIDLAARAGTDRLHRWVSDLLAYRREIDWDYWRRETPESLAVRWERYWHRVRKEILRGVARTPAARAVLRLAATAQCSNPTMQERFADLQRLLGGLPESRDPEAKLEAIYEVARVQGGGSARQWASPEQYNAFKSAAERLRKELKERLKVASFDRQAAQAAAKTALALLDVAAEAARRYDEEKRRLAALDFDDLLIRAARLLSAPKAAALRQQISAGIEMLLVDEFQDTEPVQVELIEQLCDRRPEAGRLFFVGDFKQSIYRFRGADPHVFRRLREKLPPEGRLPLSQNFRSQPAILDFVNALFEEEFAPGYEALRPARPQLGPRPGVEFLWAFPTGEMQQERGRIPVGELRQREADYIARRLRRMFDEEERLVWDDEAAARGKPAVRPVRPGDVAILFRTLSSVQLYEEALRDYGIDYYLVGGHGFYAQQEIYDLAHLLRAVDNPADVLSLVGVLRSPMFALEDETLFWLSRHPGGLGEGLLAEAVPESISEAQKRQVRYAAQVIEELRGLKDRLPVAALITLALERTGYDAALLGEFLGERKLANLYKLIEQARSFDRSGIFNLAEFATRLSEFVAREPKEPPAATCPESVDVVRLMTIHQAKGLEFPVVIVADVNSAFRGEQSAVAFRRDLGPLIRENANPERDAAGGDSLGTFELFRQMEKEEERAELMRLLYVASTRAADYLILSAGLPAIDKIASPWMELLASRFDLASGRFIGADPAGREASKAPSCGASKASSRGTSKAADAERTLAQVVTSVPLRQRRRPARRRNLEKLAEQVRQQVARGKGTAPTLIGPVPPDPHARRAFSFSRLTGQLHGPVGPAMPAAGLPDEPELDARGLGTLVHAVMAEVDFAQPGDVEALVRRHALRHLPEMADLQEPVHMIQRFLESSRAADMATAAKMYRELEFLLAWPPGTEDPKAPYLRGYIDCLYQDAQGHWRVVDYKTGHASEQNLHQAAGQYEIQMLAYGLAVEEILGCAPAALVLCFLRPGLEYHISWDARARQRIIQMIDQALSQLE